MEKRAGSRHMVWMASGLMSALLCACGVNGEPVTAATPETSDASPAAASALGAYLAGRHAQQEHDYGAAARYFGQALAQDPGDFELVNKTFLFALSEGRIDDAKDLAARISRIDPAAPLPDLMLVLQRLKGGDFAGAAAMAQTLPHDGIHRFATPLIEAWARAGLGQAGPAVAALDPLRAVQGFAPLADFHAGLISDYLGRPADAEADYLKVVQPTGRPNWRSIEALGGVYERTGRPEQARALYERVTADDQNSDLANLALARIGRGETPAPRVAGAADGAAEALFDLASILDQSETADLSLIYGRLALDLKPDFPGAQLLVADILESEHRPAEALVMDQSVAASSPYRWSARLRAASNLDALDRSNEAVAELRAMAAERPDRPEPLIQLGDLLRGKSRFAEAVTAYDGAIARIPKIEQRNWPVFYSRGIALERAGRWPAAEADLLHALELQPEQPLVLNYLGYSWVDKGLKLKEAMGMIQRAVDLRPNDGYIVDSLGWALYRLGNYTQAAQQLEHAAELHPQDPTINDHLGDAYWQTGRLAEARNQWRRALQFGPEADEVRTIEAKLDRGLAKPAPAGTTAQGG